eukprot:466190-Prorocentrum_minimum.AAC.3
MCELQLASAYIAAIEGCSPGHFHRRLVIPPNITKQRAHSPIARTNSPSSEWIHPDCEWIHPDC